MSIERDLKKFISARLAKGKDVKTLQDDDSLFETGIVDSLGVLLLVAFIEEQFNIKVEDEELIPENFETINKVKEFIERKTAIRAKK
jgi:acyl carrier protein